MNLVSFEVEDELIGVEGEADGMDEFYWVFPLFDFIIVGVDIVKILGGQNQAPLLDEPIFGSILVDPASHHNWILIDRPVLGLGRWGLVLFSK